MFSGGVDRVIINDLDKAIFAFWKIAVSNTDFLINKIKKVNIDIEEWKKQKNIYKNPKSNVKDLAFATLFLNRTNRSGIIKGGPIGGFNQSGEWLIDARFKKDIIIERLLKIKKFKNKILVSNVDGIKLIKKIDNKNNKNNYFIFFDPPYYVKGQSLYLNHYSNKNHEELLKILQNTSLKWVMTYDDNPYIYNLYKDFRKIRFSMNHSAFKSKKGKEILIFSDLVKSVPMQINGSCI